MKKLYSPLPLNYFTVYTELDNTNFVVIEPFMKAQGATLDEINRVAKETEDT